MRRVWMIVAMMSVVLTVTSTADARRRGRSSYTESVPQAAKETQADIEKSKPVDALDEVNAARKRLGLRPFQRDEALVIAAMSCAQYRARRLIGGHTYNDFAFLPRGGRASAAGCAAWHGTQWGSCCWQESWRFAGAGWSRGRDGRRYMHIFVR